MPDPAPLIYRFDRYELDAVRFELRADGRREHVEPQVLSLLLLLAENQDRLVSKDEIINKVWDGRIVSESAVAARIKAARKAIGDDGGQQKLIRTIHGKGFRFVGEARVERDARSSATVVAEPAASSTCSDTPLQSRQAPQDSRPSIAVLPFQLQGGKGPHDIVADALPADLIMDLSRLHWLFVIARGSSFRFRGADADPVSVGRSLGVRYCLTGAIETSGHDVTIGVSLSETSGSGIIWADSYRCELGELQQLRPQIETDVIANLSTHIPQNEVRLARGRPASELDAWSSFHLGLDYMYRFTQADNERAAALFRHALSRDPWFSRALAGMSFTHFQKSFMLYGGDPDEEAENARLLALRAVECDRLDPFAHFSVGRCSWLEGRLEDSIGWFDRATSLSPSFAQGIYNRGLVSTIAGQAEQADHDLDMALKLSPLDPLAYAMVSSRALTHIQMGEFLKAAEFGERAATMPGAHKHIQLIAALSLHLAGCPEKAAKWLVRARNLDPHLSAETFFHSFPYAPTGAREVVERGLHDLGL